MLLYVFGMAVNNDYGFKIEQIIAFHQTLISSTYYQSDDDVIYAEGDFFTDRKV